jgi:hypothetical protein
MRQVPESKVMGRPVELPPETLVLVVVEVPELARQQPAPAKS